MNAKLCKRLRREARYHPSQPNRWANSEKEQITDPKSPKGKYKALKRAEKAAR